MSLKFLNVKVFWSKSPDDKLDIGISRIFAKGANIDSKGVYSPNGTKCLLS